MDFKKIPPVISEHPIKSTVIAFFLGAATTYAILTPRAASAPPVCVTRTVDNDVECHRYTSNPYSDTKISENACQSPHPQCP